MALNDGWYNAKGELHRDGGEPALIMTNGDKEWYWEGKLHREGGLPAIVKANGEQFWYEHGVLTKKLVFTHSVTPE